MLCLVRDLSIFRQERGMGSIIYYRQLIFHRWPGRDERAAGVEGGSGRWDDDVGFARLSGVNPRKS